jgi:hypothetical protein
MESKCGVLACRLLIVGLMACDPGPVSLIQPENISSADGSSLTIHVTASLLDGAPAEWENGVPGATVYYARTHQLGFPWDSIRTDSSGHATVRGLRSGLYWVASAAPFQSGGAATAHYFAGGEKVSLPGRDSTVLTLLLQPARPPSLVISEVYNAEPPIWVVPTNGESKYVEIFNNTSNTIYLDGIVLGKFYGWYFDGGHYGHSRCEDTERMRNDPTGLWADVICSFPEEARTMRYPPDGKRSLLFLLPTTVPFTGPFWTFLPQISSSSFLQVPITPACPTWCPSERDPTFPVIFAATRSGSLLTHSMSRPTHLCSTLERARTTTITTCTSPRLRSSTWHTCGGTLLDRT